MVDNGKEHLIELVQESKTDAELAEKLGDLSQWADAITPSIVGLMVVKGFTGAAEAIAERNLVDISAPSVYIPSMGIDGMLPMIAMQCDHAELAEKWIDRLSTEALSQKDDNGLLCLHYAILHNMGPLAIKIAKRMTPQQISNMEENPRTTTAYATPMDDIYKKELRRILADAKTIGESQKWQRLAEKVRDATPDYWLGDGRGGGI